MRRVILYKCFYRLAHHGKGKPVGPFPLYTSIDIRLTPQLCPTSPNDTYSFVLANTETLHEKIDVLSHRVRSLEDAIKVAHSALHHNDPHPLLCDELLKIKNPIEREVVAQPQKPHEEEDALDAVGSL